MTALTAEQRAKILALKGTMTNRAASELTGHGKRTIGLIWGTIPARRRKRLYPEIPTLSPQDEIVLHRIKRAGLQGTTLHQIHTALTNKGFRLSEHSTHAKINLVNQKLRLAGASGHIRSIGTLGSQRRYVYAEPAVRAEPVVPPVVSDRQHAHGYPISQINGVSVRALRFLDGASV